MNELRTAHLNDRDALPSTESESQATREQAVSPQAQLGGPFIIESIAYVYLFEHSRSPSEIIESRRVKATQSDASSFGLRLRHTRTPGFVIEEQPLWGGQLTYRELIDEAGQTAYLRTFEFDRRLRRGQRHEFATRTFVERDPDPQTEVSFSLTIPANQVSIHLGFHGTTQVNDAWSYGPIADPNDVPTSRTHRNRLPINSNTASVYFRRPQIGSHYGIAWSWP